MWVWEFKSCHQGVLQKKMFLKIQQNLHESTCENTFLKKAFATGFSQKIFWNLKKNILSGGLLLEIYEPVTALSALQNN